MSDQVREMRPNEWWLVIRYFRDADRTFLREMGVDCSKLPTAAAWFELLEKDFEQPIEQRKFFYLLWEADNASIGHCNIDKIEFGKVAYLHLHIWESAYRQRGIGTDLLRRSILHFFKQFKLRKLLCEPYALNSAPNKVLPKAGFQFVESYETTPGWINFRQTVHLWELDRGTALGGPLRTDAARGTVK